MRKKKHAEDVRKRIEARDREKAEQLRIEEEEKRVRAQQQEERIKRQEDDIKKRLNPSSTGSGSSSPLSSSPTTTSIPTTAPITTGGSIISQFMNTGSPVVAKPPKCATCAKGVYPLEKIDACDKVYHKGCFKCKHCKMVLSLKTFATIANEPYCKPHYMEIFKSKGNYGVFTGEEKGGTTFTGQFSGVNNVNKPKDSPKEAPKEPKNELPAPSGYTGQFAGVDAVKKQAAAAKEEPKEETKEEPKEEPQETPIENATNDAPAATPIEVQEST